MTAMKCFFFRRKEEVSDAPDTLSVVKKIVYIKPRAGEIPSCVLIMHFCIDSDSADTKGPGNKKGRLQGHSIIIKYKYIKISFLTS